MEYETTKIGVPRLGVKEAKDIVSKKDCVVLEKMPTSTIIKFMYRRHKTGFYMTLTIIGWAVAFVMYLI